ncbi:hypothetical protein BELL_0449g00010 [Botrytis elliptica]|uniref:Wax synthase domain-containing protein n=1 Tax=Botrytis elliptica TaxID=278938 RepID=A0A4Z1JGP3_9HELO|nr:hypothetical protein EAE99_011855 [Botrytis elliptica]TGO72484.1 hypothetical protein BELL_0449g00010 [Botrytis elliptica]
MTVATLLTHPLLLFFANILLTNLTAVHTTTRTARLLAFALSVLLSYIALSNWNEHVNTTGWAGRFLASGSFTMPNVIFDRFIIRNWQYGIDDLRRKSIGKENQKEEKKQTKSEWGQEVVGNTRYIGTSLEVSNVPFFNAKDPILGPTRWRFCFHHAAIIVALYFLNTLAIDGQLNVNQKWMGDEYIPWFGMMFGDGIPDLRDQIFTRVTISLLYWVCQFCYLQFFFSVAALLDVGLGGGEVRRWRPFFGEAKHAYTIRGLWSKSWHQNIQLTIKGPAEFVTHSILHIPRSTLIARYLKVLITFAVSGATHVAADYGSGIYPAQSGAMSFFCAQALGIMIEDGVQEIWRLMGGKKNTLLGKIIGFIWVSVFICWSSPVWAYPFARTMRREDMILTFGALKPLLVGLKFW